MADNQRIQRKQEIVKMEKITYKYNQTKSMLNDNLTKTQIQIDKNRHTMIQIEFVVNHRSHKSIRDNMAMIGTVINKHYKLGDSITAIDNDDTKDYIEDDRTLIVENARLRDEIALLSIQLQGANKDIDDLNDKLSQSQSLLAKQRKLLGQKVELDDLHSLNHDQLKNLKLN